MRKLLTLFIAAAMTMSGIVGVAAQDTDDAVGTEIGSPAVFYDDRGNQIATLELADIEAGWSDYDENRGPARGYDFHAVHFTITNDSDAPLEINQSRFSLVDSMGLNTSRSNVRLAEDAVTNVLTDNVDLGVGESLDATLVYELFSDVTPALFMWQPDSGSLVMVNVSDSSAGESAVASGLNTPAIFADERGNVVGSIEVLEVVDDWQDYDEFYGPDRGMRHVAVEFEITNLSDAPLEMNPFNISLLDSESTNNGRSSARAIETADVQITSDRADVAPGESFQGMLVYTLYDAVEPSAVIWQPEYGVITAVILEDDGADVGIDATPELDIDVDDDDLDALATPAA